MLLQIIDCFLSSLQGGFSTSFPGTTKSLFSNHFLIVFSISLCHLAPKPMSWVLMLSQQGWSVLDCLLSVRHHSELPPSSCSVKGMQGTTSSRIPFSKESDFTVWWDWSSHNLGGREEESWWLFECARLVSRHWQELLCALGKQSLENFSNIWKIQ